MAPHQAESQDGRLLEANRSSQIKNSKEKDLPARNMASILANEICIDGIFYDLTSFEHPGGAAILMFGGNDATVHYKMIHAHHQNGFTRVHKNMTATGRAVDYSCDYKFDSSFSRDLKRQVFSIVPPGKEYATLGFTLRALTYTTLFFYCQYRWVFCGTSYLLAMAYGPLKAAIGLNVQHDANHGSLSGTYPLINDVVGWIMDWIGASKMLWMQQHWNHHAHTNEADKDPDSFSAEPFFIVNDYPPGHSRRNVLHKIQHWAFLIMVPHLWLKTAFDTEILTAQHPGSAPSGFVARHPHLTKRVKVTILFRLLYLTFHIVIPVWKAKSFQPLLHLYVAWWIGSLILSVCFLVSHNFVGSDREPLSKHSDTEGVDWCAAQVETSSTYGGRWAGYWTGGLNFQSEHHLFPRMSSAWYPYIAPTVRRVCAKHGVQYHYHETFWSNFKSLLSYMKAVGSESNWPRKKDE